MREILRGLGSHFELEGQTIPESVAKALKAVNMAAGKHHKAGKGRTDPYHAQILDTGRCNRRGMLAKRARWQHQKKGACGRKDSRRFFAY
jgi:hypothetical protein